MKEKFRKLAERFVEDMEVYEVFNFTMTDGTCESEFGIKIIEDFDSVILVTSMYGDTSGVTVSTLVIEDMDDCLEEVIDYLYDNYRNWTPVE